MQIGALIDGLAVQVLMNDTNLSSQAMFRSSLEVAAKLIGFSLEPAAL